MDDDVLQNDLKPEEEEMGHKKLLQITQDDKEELRIHWLYDVPFEDPDTLWWYLVQVGAVDRGEARREGDNIWATEDAVSKAIRAFEKEVQEQERKWRESEELMRAATRIADRLPKDPKLHRLGYERAVREVEAAFWTAHELLWEAGPVAGCQQLQRGERCEPDCGWDRSGFLAALGRELERVWQGGMEYQKLLHLVGLVRQEYVRDMRYWRFRFRSFVGGWKRQAYRRLPFGIVLLEERRWWVPPAPRGWRHIEIREDEDALIYVIVQDDPSAPLPEGWELVDFAEGEVEPPGWQRSDPEEP